MSIPRILTDLEVIQKLSDLPNANEGLSATELKAKFDEAGLAIQAWINGTLVPALTAANIPFAASTEIDADNIQAAIAAVHSQIRDAATGTLVNGSVTTEKLAPALLERVFGGVPWVSMDRPGSADDVDAAFPVGQVWLKPAFTVVNAAGDEWTGNGCTVTNGVVTGDQTAAAATFEQFLTGIGDAEDKALIFIGVKDKNAEVSRITVSINGGEEQDVETGWLEASLTAGGSLDVRFTTTWNSASLAAAGWTLENYTVVNRSKTARDAGNPREPKDWNGYLAGLLPLTSHVSPTELYIQTMSGAWWPVMAGAEEDESYLRVVGGMPVWSNRETVARDLGAMRMMTGSYAGTSQAWELTLPVEPKVLVIAPESGPADRGSSMDGYFDNPTTLLNGSSAREAFMGGKDGTTAQNTYCRSSVSLGGSVLRFVNEMGSSYTKQVRVCNRSGETYHWIAIY